MLKNLNSTLHKIHKFQNLYKIFYTRTSNLVRNLALLQFAQVVNIISDFLSRNT